MIVTQFSLYICTCGKCSFSVSDVKAINMIIYYAIGIYIAGNLCVQRTCVKEVGSGKNYVCTKLSGEIVIWKQTTVQPGVLRNSK